MPPGPRLRRMEQRVGEVLGIGIVGVPVAQEEVGLAVPHGGPDAGRVALDDLHPDARRRPGPAAPTAPPGRARRRWLRQSCSVKPRGVAGLGEEPPRAGGVPGIGRAGRVVAHDAGRDRAGGPDAAAGHHAVWSSVSTSTARLSARRTRTSRSGPRVVFIAM